jgi:exosortase/archaeosortase family protein
LFALSQIKNAKESAATLPNGQPAQHTMYQSTPIRIFGLTRGELFAGLYILGCTNGLAAKMILSVRRLGWVDAAVGTFDVSVIVLFACYIGISLVPADKRGIHLADLAVAMVLLLMIALPIGAVSWLAVTMLSLYVLLFTQSTESERRGAVILLAVTVPMLWSRLIFDLFANFILSVDALLVGWMLGTHRSGNMVEFADHSGTLAIFPSCSSLANVSLALLCWVAISESVRHERRAQDILWCLLACSTVVAVNVIRISLMGLSSAHYDLLHSPPAEVALNIFILALIVAISVLGVRRDVFSRA